MKKNQTYILGAVLAILLIAAGYIYFYVGIENVEDWFPSGEISGQWVHDMKIYYADGSSEYLSDQTSMTLYHNGAEVTAVEYIVTATASTPAGYDPWANVEIDLSTAVITASYYSSSSGNSYWSSQNSNIPDVTGSVDGAAFQVMSMYVDLESVSDESWANGNTLGFSISGSIEYRGFTGSEYGTWKAVSNPSPASFSLTYEGSSPTRDVVIEWSDVSSWTGSGGDWSDLDNDGDMNGNGALNIVDVAYLENWLLGSAGYETIYADPDVDCDGDADSDDADYLADHLNGMPGYEELYATCGGQTDP